MQSKKKETVRQFLTAEIVSRNFMANRLTSPRKCEALGYIVRRLSDLENSYSEDEIATVANDVRHIINGTRDRSDDTFSNMLALLNGERSKLAHYTSLGLATTGAVTGVVNPPVGAALTLGAIWAEETIPVVQNMFTKLKTPVLPQLPDPTLEQVYKIALASARSSCDENELFTAFVSDPRISEALGFKILMSDDEIVNAVGHKEQELVKTCLQSEGESIEKTKVLLGSLSNGLDELRKLTNSMVAEKGNSERTKSLALEFDSISAELEGCANIAKLGIAIFGSGNPKAARDLEQTVSASMTVFKTIKNCIVNTGFFTITGGLAAGALSLISIFRSQQSDVDQLKEFISEQIAGLANQIDQNFKMLFEDVDYMKRKLDLIYTALVQLDLRMARRLASLKEEVGLARWENLLYHRERYSFEIRSIIEDTRGLVLNASDDGYSSDKRKYLTAFFMHATHTSRLNEFAGYAGEKTLVDISKKMRSRNFGIEIFGLLTPIMVMLGLRDDDANSIPNPLEWCIGTQAYIELALTPDSHPDHRFVDRTKALWSEAEDLVSTIYKITNGEAIERARRLYIEQVWRFITYVAEHSSFDSPPSEIETYGLRDSAVFSELESSLSILELLVQIRTWAVNGLFWKDERSFPLSNQLLAEWSELWRKELLSYSADAETIRRMLIDEILDDLLFSNRVTDYHRLPIELEETIAKLRVAAISAGVNVALPELDESTPYTIGLHLLLAAMESPALMTTDRFIVTTGAKVPIPGLDRDLNSFSRFENLRVLHPDSAGEMPRIQRRFDVTTLMEPTPEHAHYECVLLRKSVCRLVSTDSELSATDEATFEVNGIPTRIHRRGLGFGSNHLVTQQQRIYVSNKGSGVSIECELKWSWVEDPCEENHYTELTLCEYCWFSSRLMNL